MEESVWLYFGVLAVLIAIAIIASLFAGYRTESAEETLFASVQQLGKQADLVCKAPRDTMLSMEARVPGGAVLYAVSDRLCARFEGKIKCVPTECLLEERTLINLTSEEARQLVGVRDYTCAFTNAPELHINCQG